ncbi:MAG TPA: TlpA disulfide reductase family protein [Candidatus Limnocylindria bacterium]|nr:TlpA disulfide reductase family protein [Candidatus Limnocylindria bacterium]
MTQRSRTSRAPRRQEPLDAKRPFPLIPVVIAGIVVLVLAAILAVALAGGGGGGGTSGEPARVPVKVTGQVLPAYPESGGSDPAVGSAIPTLDGVTFDNSSMSIGPSDGPMLVVFLAHWCPHCQAEVPRIQDWLNSGGLPDGVKLVSVATSTSSTRPNYPPSAWLKRENWTPPVLVDDADSTALQAFGMNSFPAFVFVDGNGKVVARTTGEIAIDQLQAVVDQLARL